MLTAHAYIDCNKTSGQKVMVHRKINLKPKYITIWLQYKCIILESKTKCAVFVFDNLYFVKEWKINISNR